MGGAAFGFLVRLEVALENVKRARKRLRNSRKTSGICWYLPEDRRTFPKRFRSRRQGIYAMTMVHYPLSISGILSLVLGFTRIPPGFFMILRGVDPVAGENGASL
jgi:hypothetical protein